MKALKIGMMSVPVGSLFGAVLTHAQIAQPGLIYYKGLMADYQGKLVHDTLSVTFSIYDAPTGGNLMWTETHPSMIIWGGVYTVLLGAIEPFPVELFWDPVGGTVVRKGSDRWLGVTIEGLTELSTRKRITTVAYAVNADVVDGRHAAEFVSSVHPDTMRGVDWCSHSIPMLTVINDCDGGAIEGNCPDGPGVTGVGETGIYATTDDAEGIAVHGVAESLATQAGFFDGNVTVNGDAQVGSHHSDYHYVRWPGKDAWGYLYSSYPLDDTSAIDIAYNYHVDPSGTETFDNGTVNTSEIRMGHEGIEFRTGKSMNSPKTRMLIDPEGKVTFFAAVSAPRANFDTLYVPDTCWAGDKFEIEGSLGVGAPAPTNYKLHVKGDGNYAANGIGGKGSNHVALFENDYSGDGIAIKLSDGTPDYKDNFISFVGLYADSSDKQMGRIEGCTQLFRDQRYVIDKMFFTAEGLRIAIAAAGWVLSTVSCPGAGVAICFPRPAQGVYIAGLAVALHVKLLIYEAYRHSTKGVSYQSGSADYAEWLERMNGDEQMEAGDIVGVCGGKISKETDDAQQILVVSKAPIFVGNMPPVEEKHLYEQVAFIGQVPVKVVGPVSEGDYIIPSGFEDGTGIAVSPELMTADEYSKVVGRAWSRSDNICMKYVHVAIGMNNGDVATVLGKQKMKSQELRDRLQRVRSALAEYNGLEQKITKLEGVLEKTDEGEHLTFPRDDEK